MSINTLQSLMLLVLGGVAGSLLTWLFSYYQSQYSGKKIHSKIKRLIDANLIGVYIADFTGTIFESNDAFLNMVGYTREDLHTGRMNWATMTPPHYLPADQKALEQQRLTGICIPFEKEYYRKDGSLVPVLFGCTVFDQVLKRSIGFVVDLTEQKQMEEALRISEARFRRFAEANLIGVVESTLDGTYVKANDTFLKMLGYTREDLNVGRINWRQITPPEYHPLDQQVDADLETNGVCRPFEKEYYRKDGSRVPTLVSLVNVEQAERRDIGFVVDLTEQKRAEEALRKSEARFRRFVEANLIGVTESTLNGTYIEANDAFLNMLGYTREDLYAGQLNWHNLTPPGYEQLDQQLTAELEAEGVCQPFEKEYYRKDGSRIPILMGLVNVEQEERRDISFVVDLSEQKRIEVALRKSEAKFRRFVEANLIGVTESTLNGTYIEANDAFLNMLGYTREDLYAGRLNWQEMTPPGYEQLDQQVTNNLVTQGICRPFEKEYYRKDGSQVPVLLGLVDVEQDERRTLGFILDLTDRKQAEMASVLEERNRIARDIHDTLAQSFTSILVHLEVAFHKLATNDISIVKDCLQTSYELAQTGLAEARRSVAALRPQHLELKDFYTALCKIAEQMFAHTPTKLICTCDGDRYLLQPDIEEHLLRIGQEALMNAAKYAQSSEIRLTVRYEPMEYVLQITDNGKGFSWSDQNARRASSEGGFGILGMQERAERIGARLSIQTALGQGTTIQVWINRGN
jgi:PAS domain S-box-containing protein